MSTVASQLEQIHSMLAAGHRSIRLQRHSLLLWGITGGILCLGTEHVITPERFPGHLERAVALLLFLAIMLSGVAIADFWYTRHRIEARDESMPFVQAQLTKVWWLLIGMGVLFTFATAFFGGGQMVFVSWLVLFGLGIYVHGLFSEQILEWAGVMMILLGIGALAWPASYVATQWLAASAFGLGMPLLAAMLDRGESKSAWTRIGQSALWLAVVLPPAVFGYQWRESQRAPDAPTMTLESFLRQGPPQGNAIVAIPAGTRIPLKVRIHGNIVQDESEFTVPLTLARPIDVVLVDSKTNGIFRVADGAWKRRSNSLWIRDVQLRATLEPSTGPAASMSMSLTVGN
jgi:hypothetical protein